MVETWQILHFTGFRCVASSSGVPDIRYVHDFGPHRIEARLVTDHQFRSAFLFTGVWSTARSSDLIEFFVPKQMPSREHVLALLAINLGPHIRSAAPEAVPSWIKEGEEHVHLLNVSN